MNDKRPLPESFGSADDLSIETKLWRLAEIVSAARRIHSSLTLDEVLASFLDIALAEVGAAGASIYLSDGDGGLKVGRRRVSWQVSAPEARHWETVAKNAARSGDTGVMRGEESRTTIVNIPLRDETDSGIGVLQIYLHGDSSMDDSSMLFLRELSHFASLSIRNAQYHEDSLVKTQLEREIAVAREIQLGTIPQEMPVLPGYDVAGISRPAEETGGDTFDVVRTGNGLALLLADATGHGIGPALSVTQVRAMLRLAVRIGADIAGIYRHINDQLCEDLQDHRFVTAFMGQLEANEHRILYYSPGQGQLLHYHHATDACEWLGASAPPLGILPTADVGDPEVLNLEPGDIFGLLTDGVFEAIDTSEEEFGEDRVSNTVRTSRAESCANLVGRVLAEVDAHRDGVPQQDDITIVFVRRGL